MAQITDADILAVLNGIAKPPVDVLKDLTAGDAHVPSAGGDKPAAVADKKPEDEDVAKALQVTIAKIDAVDIVFSKGQANLYVSRPLTSGSAQRLEQWAKDAGIKNVVPAELMHVTQVHSTAEVDTTKLTPLSTLVDIDPGGRWLSRLGKGNALVMFFFSKELQDRFREAMAAGASWDFPSYMPHITLSYDTEPPPPPKDKLFNSPEEADFWSMIPAPDMLLQLGPEEFEASNDNWAAENKLVAKGDGGLELQIAVSKADPVKRMIFGWASVTHVDKKLIIDKQDDAIQLLDDTDGSTGLESAAYEFVLYGRDHGDMHSKVGTGKLVESMVFTPEKEALGIVAKNEKGQIMYGWWTGFRVDDAATWKAVAAGTMPEFSIGGKATPVQMS